MFVLLMVGARMLLLRSFYPLVITVVARYQLILIRRIEEFVSFEGQSMFLFGLKLVQTHKIRSLINAEEIRSLNEAEKVRSLSEAEAPGFSELFFGFIFAKHFGFAQ